MSYEEAYEMLSEMSEEERVEAFSVALGLLNEYELEDMMEHTAYIESRSPQIMAAYRANLQEKMQKINSMSLLKI